MKNPDKWIRKYFYSRLNGMVVNGRTIPVYDSNTPNNDEFAVILSTQSGSDDRLTKCFIEKNREILVDVFTRYPPNTGSRAFLDDIVEKILELTEVIEIENFSLNYFSITYPSDLTLNTSTETIHRKILNYNLNLE